MIANTHVTCFVVKIISYDNPTTILRQCSLLHGKVKLKSILAMECLPEPCDPWTPENCPNRP